jgi:hypothetical protein
MQDLRDRKADRADKADLSDHRDIKAIKATRVVLFDLRVDKAARITIQAPIIKVAARVVTMARDLQAPDTRVIIQDHIMTVKAADLSALRVLVDRDRDRDTDRLVPDTKVETVLPVDIIKDQDPEGQTDLIHQDQVVPAVLDKDRDIGRQAARGKVPDQAAVDITKVRDRVAADIRDRLKEAVLIISAVKRM